MNAIRTAVDEPLAVNSADTRIDADGHPAAARGPKCTRPHLSLQALSWHTILATRLTKNHRRHEALRRQCAQRMAPNALHDLRVSTRRQLALIGLIRALGGVRTGKLRRALHRCLDATSAARDAGVQCERVSGGRWRDAAGPELAASLRSRARRKARAAQAELLHGVRKLTRRTNALADRLRQADLDGAAAMVIAVLRATIDDAEAASELARRNPEYLHKARLALKRLRYLAEILRGRVPGITAAWISALRTAQRRMGEIHDLELLARHIQEKQGARSARRPGRRRLSDAIRRRRGVLLRGYRPAMPSLPPRLWRFLGRKRAAAG